MRSALLKKLGFMGPLIDGSTLVAHHSCGNKKGKKLAQMRVQRYRGRKQHSVHVPRDLEETVQKWNDEYRRALSLLHEIGEISEQIIRNYIRDKRAACQPSAVSGQPEIIRGKTSQ